MEYKGYIGEFTFDDKRELFLGHISNTKGIIMFQGKSIGAPGQAWCLKHGKSPEIPSNDNLEIDADQDSA